MGRSKPRALAVNTKSTRATKAQRKAVGGPNDGPWESPAPAEIRRLREAHGLTQTQAGALCRSAMRSWQDWESGARRMHPGLFELFKRSLPPS